MRWFGHGDEEEYEEEDEQSKKWNPLCKMFRLQLRT